MLSSTTTFLTYCLSIVHLLNSAKALPFNHSEGRSRFAVVNVDGSSEPSQSSVPAAVTTDTATTTIAPVITIPPYNPQHTQTITVTAEPSFTSIPANSSTISYRPSSSILRNSTTASSASPSIAMSSTPCKSVARSTSAPTPIPTPCEDADDVYSQHAWEHGGASWGPKATLSRTSHTTPSSSYPSGAHAMRPSGMTKPLPILPSEGPHTVNKTQIPYHRRKLSLFG